MKEQDQNFNRKRHKRSWSRIAGSPIEEFIINGSGVAQSQEELFNSAVAVFVDECRETLCLSPIDSEQFSKRFEPHRAFIVKVLLYLGVLPNSQAFLQIAHLIEHIVSMPNLVLSDCIKNTADQFKIDVAALSRTIDKYFNVYDNVLYEKITYLTHTKPMTSKDALYDISSYVNAKMLSVASGK